MDKKLMIADVVVMVVSIAWIVVSLCSCSGEVYAGVRRIDEYKSNQSMTYKPMSCLFWNFEECKQQPEVKGS